MRIHRRLQRLEQCVSAGRQVGDGDGVEIWIPANGRGGLPPGRYPCEGTPNVLVIYEPQDELPPARETPP